MKVFGVVVLMLFFGVMTTQAAPTSKNNSKIRKFFNLYPKSDANRDGVLSTTEMKAFLLKKISSSATSKNSASMRRFLSNAPGADINRDGVLKKSELIKYLGRL